MLNPELKKLQVMAGILRDETQHITDGIILSESEVLQFEGLWNEEARLVEIEQLNEVDKEKVKQLMAVIKDIAMWVFAKLNKAGRMVWDNLWMAIGWVLKTVFKSPMVALLTGLGITAYSVLTDVLNFKIMNVQFNIGDKLDAGFMSAVESGWDSMVEAIRGYDVETFAYKPVEWLANATATGLEAIGEALPVAIDTAKALFQFIMEMGIAEPMGIILLWLFLIGGGNWAFEKVKNIIVEPIKKLLNKPVDKAVDQVKQLSGPVSKDQINKGQEFADKLKGVDLKGVDVTNPGATNMNQKEQT